MINFLSSLFGSILVCCYANASIITKPYKDFFITTQDSLGTFAKPITEDLTLCRKQIAKVVCIVDPAAQGEDITARQCQDNSIAYAAVFENLFDQYPSALQKMFCSLKHIYIEKEFVGTAYASQIQNKDGILNGAFIGIRKSVIDENLNLQTWATWKEQLSFGGVKDSYQLTASLPSIQTQQSTQANDFLFFVIAHEFGHLFDFANHLNAMKDCPPDEDVNQPEPECAFEPNTWGALSWETNLKPRAENLFWRRSDLCFYWCKNDGTGLNANDTNRLYSEFYRTDFISLYATTQAWDDFADSLAYFMLVNHLQSNYTIDTQQGIRFDIVKKLNSVRFAKKNQYIVEFLGRKNIIYP